MHETVTEALALLDRAEGYLTAGDGGPSLPADHAEGVELLAEARALLASLTEGPYPTVAEAARQAASALNLLDAACRADGLAPDPLHRPDAEPAARLTEAAEALRGLALRASLTEGP